MSNLLNLAEMSEEEFIYYRGIVKMYYSGGVLNTFLAKDLPYSLMKDCFINIWFDPKTLLVHHPDEPAVLKDCYNGNEYIWYWIFQGKIHKIDGPASNDTPNNYAIDNIYYHEKEYWNHPEVIAFKYLKEHPELQAFI